jgi:hypothetical protein
MKLVQAARSLFLKEFVLAFLLDKQSAQEGRE